MKQKRTYANLETVTIVGRIHEAVVKQEVGVATRAVVDVNLAAMADIEKSMYFLW